MILPSKISADAHAYIRSRLESLAAREGVRILFAIESGSRAWGFPSADSDYDVRFVYVRPQSDYLSIREWRDVIETPTLDDPVLGVPLDLNGWDLRKALRLALSSNPVLHEWLTSPIIYARDEEATSAIHSIAVQVSVRDQFRYHYDRLCRTSLNQMQTPDGATIKRYCYALRPSLMLRWLNTRTDLPPMDIHNLCAGLALDEGFLEVLSTLIESKSSRAERERTTSLDVLDEFIRTQLETVVMRPDKIDVSTHRCLPHADEILSGLLRP
ncbi:nucleotidyltransferase domain-containing protein (plasmid) [Asticcacaulis sp. DW145]|uniref:nucleotidyltransferase domain-containing protein n=1 Tax=Asticcacaulis sp. DW145 TaxID=3095608 RepID=UPI00308B77EB|nr:nucleotidyltransferase domain-containing protein [Asticcacaulis sp. DW145]